MANNLVSQVIEKMESKDTSQTRLLNKTRLTNIRASANGLKTECDFNTLRLHQEFKRLVLTENFSASTLLSENKAGQKASFYILKVNKIPYVVAESLEIDRITSVMANPDNAGYESIIFYDHDENQEREYTVNHTLSQVLALTAF